MNKFEFIADYLEPRHKNMTPREVYEEIKKNTGVEVNINYLTKIKCTLGYNYGVKGLELAHKKYIEDNFEKCPTTILTNNLNEEFGTNFTYQSIYLYVLKIRDPLTYLSAKDKKKFEENIKHVGFNPYHKGYSSSEHLVKMRLETLKEVMKNTPIELQINKIVEECIILLSYSHHVKIKKYKKNLLKLKPKVSIIKQAYIDDFIICIDDL